MGLEIPGELASLLSLLGYDWPEGDETKLFELGQVWVDFGSTVQQMAADADVAVQRALASGSGEALEAFGRYWSGEDGPGGVAGGNATAASVLGAAYMVVAGIVLALKIQIIVQLTLLAIQIAQAIATAVVTFGASLLEIPIFKMITSLLIDQLIDIALQAVLGG